ncbi:MAG: Hsp20/alpha crystallin family protein [Promethearchaeota archaeon]
MSDDYDDIFDEIRKFFKFNSNMFDADFFFLPESNPDSDFDKENAKGFKVSYHYESGMDKPEIKIEGDIDEKKLQEYLKNRNFETDSRFKKLFTPKPNGIIDASELSMEPNPHKDKSKIIEPYIEINHFDDFLEVIIEVPGIIEDDIILNFDENEKKLIFKAQNKNRNYLKYLYLPLDISMEQYTLEVNNGIAILRFRREQNQD